MRMWMLPTAGMCRKHLLGEHVELHMLLGSLRRGKNIEGFLAMIGANSTVSHASKWQLFVGNLDDGIVYSTATKAISIDDFFLELFIR